MDLSSNSNSTDPIRFCVPRNKTAFTIRVIPGPHIINDTMVNFFPTGVGIRQRLLILAQHRGHIIFSV